MSNKPKYKTNIKLCFIIMALLCCRSLFAQQVYTFSYSYKITYTYTYFTKCDTLYQLPMSSAQPLPQFFVCGFDGSTYGT
jgi:hypothetical protein